MSLIILSRGGQEQKAWFAMIAKNLSLQEHSSLSWCDSVVSIYKGWDPDIWKGLLQHQINDHPFRLSVRSKRTLAKKNLRRGGLSHFVQFCATEEPWEIMESFPFLRAPPASPQQGCCKKNYKDGGGAFFTHPNSILESSGKAEGERPLLAWL